MGTRSILVLGDQLNRFVGPLAEADADDTTIVFVHAADKRRAARWHRQRLHLYETGMRRLADELRALGFAVDERDAPSLRAGVRGHAAEHEPDHFVAMRPPNRRGATILDDLADDIGLEVRDNTQFLCSREDFAAWADGGDLGAPPDEPSPRHLRMEDFYRRQRVRLDVLMDGDDPAGGRWNHDHDNREPPPGPDHPWPTPVTSTLDDVDAAVLAGFDDQGLDLVGAPPDGTWPTTRRQALARLRHFVTDVLPGFGPHQDVMLQRSWATSHALLSSALNLGLLDPGEVVERVEEAYRAGDVPINSAEGFVRQVIGWREYVHGVYWYLGPEHAGSNVLDADLPVPPAFRDPDRTQMHCVGTVAGWVRDLGWAGHIPRLMVLANLATSAGVNPQALTAWMHASFVDAADWVMVPNVVGMGTYADGGALSTKPYVSAGAYIDRMSDFCGDCRFDRRKRVGEDACPFTTLYWDFLDRNRHVLGDNHRLARPYANLERLSDLDAVRHRATEVRARLADGTL